MAFAPTSLTKTEAPEVLQAGLSAIAQGATEIDLQHLKHFDSSAVAALLAWRRAAEAAAIQLRLLSLPAGLNSLAGLYGVNELLAT